MNDATPNLNGNDATPDYAKRFDEKVNELRRQIPSRTREVRADFGYKCKDGNTIYTMYDMGAIKQFIIQEIETALEQQKQELIDEIEKVIQEERYAGAPYALNKLIEIIKTK